MPELPEVENVRRGLARSVLGRRIRSVEVRRADVVQGPADPGSLLSGQDLVQVARLGKQLALVGSGRQTRDTQLSGPCVCVHLGMTGSLRYCPSKTDAEKDNHTHVIWRLAGGGSLIFRDPRRFGGLWTYPSMEELESERWSQLGQDALNITPVMLHRVLQKTRRPLKAALLDQSVVAGLGNIYVDELLFACRLSPTRPAGTCTSEQTKRMVATMRRLLNRAIRSGGSTLRDYVGADGRSGGFQTKHKVYGRGGLSCVTCQSLLMQSQVAGRTTVSCQSCQQ